MIKITRQPMSEDLRARYEAKVFAPGKRWLEQHQDKNRRPKDYWREVHADIAEAFALRCAYTATWQEYGGTVDHFISIDEDRSKAYDWDNFRYCAGWFNAKKQNISAEHLLDPLHVEEGWFELTIPDMQLVMTELCPPEFREKARFMLEELGLRGNPKLRKARQAYWDLFEQEGVAALKTLEKFAPLVARAARKHLAMSEAQSSTNDA